jgi:hypothetical protein
MNRIFEFKGQQKIQMPILTNLDSKVWNLDGLLSRKTCLKSMIIIWK